ncbi:MULTISPECIES: DUF3653 domain-containing protein [Thalassospira]|uniref:Uncharacterized protein n=1 Tax=Thalassospira xianhensis MCCC 1A02616 TaxID=1177929 RepID=A0A367U5A8_9PROT|nr:hypothetical protein TH5_25350 [Thalassospira xianhensis MCCC 1A02616]
MIFRDLCFGLSVKEISAITYRHPSTVRRYLRTNKAPPHVLHLVNLYRVGRLPSLHESWRGWRMNGELLVDPDGNGYRANEIKSLWAVRQLRRELERLRARPAQFVMDF